MGGHKTLRLTAIGGPTAAVIALHNLSLQVNVLDRDESRIQRWKSAHLPIHEPGLDEVVRTARDGAVCDNIEESSQGTSPRSPNLNFTTDSKACLSQADMIFLAVNTPTKTFGCGTGRATNMNAVDDAVRDIGKYAKDGVIIVEKSTVPCGTAKRISSSVSFLDAPNAGSANAHSFGLSDQIYPSKSFPTQNSCPKDVRLTISSGLIVFSLEVLRHRRGLQLLPLWRDCTLLGCLGRESSL